MGIRKDGEIIPGPAFLESNPFPRQPKSRDFEAEARGKVAHGAYVAAVSSPLIATLQKDEADADRLIEKYAQLIITKAWAAQRNEYNQ